MQQVSYETRQVTLTLDMTPEVWRMIEDYLQHDESGSLEEHLVYYVETTLADIAEDFADSKMTE